MSWGRGVSMDFARKSVFSSLSDSSFNSRTQHSLLWCLVFPRGLVRHRENFQVSGINSLIRQNFSSLPLSLMPSFFMNKGTSFLLRSLTSRSVMTRLLRSKMAWSQVAMVKEVIDPMAIAMVSPLVAIRSNSLPISKPDSYMRTPGSKAGHHSRWH